MTRVKSWNKREFEKLLRKNGYKLEINRRQTKNEQDDCKEAHQRKRFKTLKEKICFYGILQRRVRW